MVVEVLVVVVVVAHVIDASTASAHLRIWGGTAGNWGRRQVDLDEIELMIVGRRV